VAPGDEIMVYALIVAAGKGTRMGESTAKQFLPLEGEPILLRTLRVFDDSEVVEHIILVVPREDFALCRRMVIDALDGATPIELAAGGASRQISVYNGLKAIPRGGDHMVVIHDGVRPFVDPIHIATILQTARKEGACILGIPVFDTIKQVNDSGTVIRTQPRDCLWIAQTPQAFDYDLISAAHDSARHHGFQATDDASLVERNGHPVQIVEGSRFNIKITHPDDMKLAAAIIRSGRI